MATLERALELAVADRDATAALVAELQELIAQQRAGTLPPPLVVTAPPALLDPDLVSRPVAWGAKVSTTFVARAWWTAVTLGFDPDWLMACIAWESGETFSAKVKNKAGSGATGLIQFMPKTAIGLETTTAALAAMTAEDQIRYVYKYFRPWAGKIDNLADCYMCILLPKMVGKPDDAVMFAGEGASYRQNSGLDSDRDGKVTKLEAAAKVLAKLATGRKPQNMGTGR